MRETPTDIRRAKSSRCWGYLMIWGMPVAWAFGAAMWVAHLQFQLDELFFSETTHTLWDVCFVEFLWGKWFSLLKRFFGWLPPTVLYIYLPVPGGTNHFRPTVSAHFSPSLLWMGCLHACSTVICVCSPVFLRGVAQLSASIVFCSQLCLKFISQYLRFFVLQSPEGVQNVRGLLRNTSRNVLWEVSPTVIYSIWNQSQSLAIFLGRFPKRFSGGFHQSWSMYHCRTSILKENNTPIHLHSCKRSIMVFFGLISGVQFRVPSYFIIFPSLDGKIEVDVQRP